MRTTIYKDKFGRTVMNQPVQQRDKFGRPIQPVQQRDKFGRPIQPVQQPVKQQPVKQPVQKQPVKQPANQIQQARTQPAQPKVQKVKKEYEKLTDQQRIQEAFKVYKEVYENRIKQTTIDAIVNGEILTTEPVNIFVDEETDFEDPKFEAKLKFCNKKLYNYQENAIKKIRELELNGEHVCKETGEKIKSNGWLLHLPIGSGKTLVFTFLAIMYKKIPARPIIMSTSGSNIPDEDIIQLKYYPFYYENAGYIEGQESAVICMKDYVQRPTTVIITHFHLLDQLAQYIKDDFNEALLKKTKISFVTRLHELNNNTLNSDILVVPATVDIIKRLVALSYEAPFMRIIVDDYTNMNSVDEYRQILATSTLFVSGSGFERDKSKIPPSYYTLRHIDVNKFSLVADPSDTMKGILRDSVATFNLIGSETEFSSYKFINDIEECCLSRFNAIPGVVYPLIDKNGNKLIDYMALQFLLFNLDRFSFPISNVENDIASGKLKPERVSWYLKWKAEQVEKIPEMYKDKGEIKKRETVNLFFKALNSKSGNVGQGNQALVQQKCSVCGLTFDHTCNGWGFVSTCCGSFFCEKCAKCMATNKLIFHECDAVEELRTVVDELNSYCVVCHRTNPTYFVNAVRNKINNNLQGYNLVDTYCDNSDLSNSAHFDYYFKMLLEGFKPKYIQGRAIDVELKDDYNASLFDVPEEINTLVPVLYPKDRLTMLTLERLDATLRKLEIKPIELNKTSTPCVLFYDCPQHLEKRVTDYFKSFSNNKESALYGLDLVFKKNMSSLIGLHRNILAIVVWKEPANTDEIHQLIGRILRLNTWNNPLYFYITCKELATGAGSSKVKEIEQLEQIDEESTEAEEITENMISDALGEDNGSENVVEETTSEHLCEDNGSEPVCENTEVNKEVVESSSEDLEL